MKDLSRSVQNVTIDAKTFQTKYPSPKDPMLDVVLNAAIAFKIFFTCWPFWIPIKFKSA